MKHTCETDSCKCYLTENIIQFYIFYWGIMCIFKIVKPLSMYVLKVLYMINYSKQITTPAEHTFGCLCKTAEREIQFLNRKWDQNHVKCLLLVFKTVLISETMYSSSKEVQGREGWVCPPNSTRASSLQCQHSSPRTSQALHQSSRQPQFLNNHALPFLLVICFQ